MLVIRKEQEESLLKVSESVFVDRMVQHIAKHFPTHYLELGAENCRELIGFGIERGAEHEFVSERNVCKFIDLMLCFGVDFDTDEQLPWAAEILNSDSWINADAKMNALFAEGVRRLEK